MMQFVAKTSEILPVELEQAELDVFIRLNGLVIGHFRAEDGTLVMGRESCTSKGVNLVVED